MTNRQTLFGALLVLALLVQPMWMNYPPAEASRYDANPVADQDSVSETGGADILAADVSPTRDGAYRIAVVVGTGGVFSLTIATTLGGSPVEVVEFNGAVGALTANRGYTFVWPARANRFYNFRTDTSGTVTLYVEYIRDGTL